MNDKEKVDAIRAVIKKAEEWCDKQEMPESSVVIAALKNIRRIIRN